MPLPLDPVDHSMCLLPSTSVTMLSHFSTITFLCFVLFSTLFAGLGVADDICTPPLPTECNPPTKRDALGLMFKRELFKRTCPANSGPATHCNPSEPTLHETIDLQCGSQFGDGNDYPGAILYEITDCPVSVAAGQKCIHVKVTLPSGTLGPTKLDIATDPSGLPPTQGDGDFNIGVCPNGECWATLDSVKTLLSITDLCNKELLFTFHIEVNGDTCFPRDPTSGNNVPLGQAWFIAQKVLITCPAGTCCCCPVTTPPQGKFCTIGTGFGVPLVCSGICNTNTLIGLGCGRWGWYHNIGSLPYGPVDFHVGAGKNDLSKGESAGTVEVKTCSSGSGICAFYVMKPGYRLNSAHVDVRCGLNAIKTKAQSTNGYPCAPGQYNTNGGGGCPGPDGLGGSWESQPFPSCSPALPISAIFHGTVSKSLNPGDQGFDTCVEGCGNSDTTA